MRKSLRESFASGQRWRLSYPLPVQPLELLGETRRPKAPPDASRVAAPSSSSSPTASRSCRAACTGSEEELAAFGCARARKLEAPCVLVGGLGMGFTLRATLDVLPADATVVVAELMPAVVEWNRGPLGPLAGHPLEGSAHARRGRRRRRRAARERGHGSTPSCSTSTTARPRSPRRRTRRSTTTPACGRARGAAARWRARGVVGVGRSQVRAAAEVRRLPRRRSSTCAPA